MYPPQVETSGGRWQYWTVQMESEIARLALHGADEQFSIAFMFSPTYLRLEGKIPCPQDWDVGACTDGDSDCRDLHGGR